MAHEDTDPKQTADEVQTSTPENKANEDPATSKPVAISSSHGPVSQAMDPDDVAAIEELDDPPSDHNGRPDWRRVAKLAGQSRAVRKERTRARDLEFKEAEAAALLKIKAARQRATDTERQRRHRASKDAQNQKALERLIRATANPMAHPNHIKQLEQLRGKEVAYTRPERAVRRSQARSWRTYTMKPGARASTEIQPYAGGQFARPWRPREALGLCGRVQQKGLSQPTGSNKIQPVLLDSDIC